MDSFLSEADVAAFGQKVKEEADVDMPAITRPIGLDPAMAAVLQAQAKAQAALAVLQAQAEAQAALAALQAQAEARAKAQARVDAFRVAAASSAHSIPSDVPTSSTASLLSAAAAANAVAYKDVDGKHAPADRKSAILTLEQKLAATQAMVNAARGVKCAQAVVYTSMKSGQALPADTTQEQLLLAKLQDLTLNAKEVCANAKNTSDPRALALKAAVLEDKRNLQREAAHMQNQAAYLGLFMGIQETATRCHFINAVTKNHVKAGEALSQPASRTNIDVYRADYNTQRPPLLMVKYDMYVAMKNGMSTSASTSKDATNTVAAYWREFYADGQRCKMMVLNGRTIHALNREANEACLAIEEQVNMLRHCMPLTLSANAPAHVQAAAATAATAGNTRRAPAGGATR